MTKGNVNRVLSGQVTYQFYSSCYSSGMKDDLNRENNYTSDLGN